VGAFSACMSGLNRVKAAEVIHARYKQSRPTIGICIGMQVLFADSDENGARGNQNMADISKQITRTCLATYGLEYC
jgi:imidazole glycerol-phosphate synthase subunit HisH